LSPMEPPISLLEKWYLQRCNGEWEHQWGVSIETLDEWIQYWVEKNYFQAACGPLNLSEAIQIFIDWFEA
jgi:Immunity protein 53